MPFLARLLESKEKVSRFAELPIPVQEYQQIYPDILPA
jgi:hypothetical protein